MDAVFEASIVVNQPKGCKADFIFDTDVLSVVAGDVSLRLEQVKFDLMSGIGHYGLKITSCNGKSQIFTWTDTTKRLKGKEVLTSDDKLVTLKDILSATEKEKDFWNIFVELGIFKKNDIPKVVIDEFVKKLKKI